MQQNNVLQMNRNNLPNCEVEVGWGGGERKVQEGERHTHAGNE